MSLILILENPAFFSIDFFQWIFFFRIFHFRSVEFLLEMFELNDLTCPEYKNMIYNVKLVKKGRYFIGF